MNKVSERIYRVDEVIVFQKNNDAFGELSNMHGGFPLIINEITIRTNEALYQACRFPNFPDIQREIVELNSPMAVKYKSRKYLSQTRKDWEIVQVVIMRWCLRVKMVQHLDHFGKVLLSTDNYPIVELSKIDSFWGAKPIEDNMLIGCNVLGRLLMELREEFREQPNGFFNIKPPNIDDFLLLGEIIGTITPITDNLTASDHPTKKSNSQTLLPFDW